MAMCPRASRLTDRPTLARAPPPANMTLVMGPARRDTMPPSLPAPPVPAPRVRADGGQAPRTPHRTTGEQTQ